LPFAVGYRQKKMHTFIDQFPCALPVLHIFETMRLGAEQVRGALRNWRDVNKADDMAAE
jgi:hypothetical protein